MKSVRDLDYSIFVATATLKTFAETYAPAQAFLSQLKQMGIATIKMCLATADFTISYSLRCADASDTTLAMSVQHISADNPLERQNMSQAPHCFKFPGLFRADSPAWGFSLNSSSCKDEFKMISNSITQSGIQCASSSLSSKDRDVQWESQSPIEWRSDIGAEVLTGLTLDDLLVGLPEEGSLLGNSYPTPDDPSSLRWNFESSECALNTFDFADCVPKSMSGAQLMHGNRKSEGGQVPLDAFLVTWPNSTSPMGS